MGENAPSGNDFLERQVAQRYAEAARRIEPELCCPVSYDPRFLKAIPQEVLDRDYGCGDPSAFLRSGETVLDLGSGGGKICFIASQVVGPQGRVIGVDANDEMLALARRAAPEVARTIGFDNVRFVKARIQDLALDLDRLEDRLRERPARGPLPGRLRGGGSLWHPGLEAPEFALADRGGHRVSKRDGGGLQGQGGPLLGAQPGGRLSRTLQGSLGRRRPHLPERRSHGGLRQDVPHPDERTILRALCSRAAPPGDHAGRGEAVRVLGRDARPLRPGDEGRGLRRDNRGRPLLWGRRGLLLTE